MYKKFEKSQYKKDYRKLVSQNKNTDKLDSLVKELQSKNFAHAYKNHKLESQSKDIGECHVGSPTSDWVLVYAYEDDRLILILIRTGSHSEIFKSNKRFENFNCRMKFKLIEELNEDFEVVDGIMFSQLMDAALNNDGDFVLNPPGITGTIDLSEDNWFKLCDAMFDLEDDNTVYTDEEWKEYIAAEEAFARRYNCAEI